MMSSCWSMFQFIVFASTILYASERSLQQANFIDLLVTKYLIVRYLLTHIRWLTFFIHLLLFWYGITILTGIIPARTRTRWALVANRSFHVIRAYTRLSKTILFRHKLVITTRLITIFSKLIILVRTRIRLAKEICSNNNSRWSKEVPAGLLSLIQQRLPVPDQLQFGAVCRCWQSATRVVSSLPWLVIGAHPLSNTNPLFYSLGEKKVYQSCPPPMSRRGCVGSVEGWLIMVDNVLWHPESFMSPQSLYSLLHPSSTTSTNFNTSNFFFNPISGARVDLPSQSTIPCSNSDQPSFFCKVIASSVPTTAPPCDCLVAAICSDGGLAFCGLTDKVWTFIDHARHLVFNDIEITGGKLYAAPKWSNEFGSQFMMVFDIQNICSNGGGCPSTFTIDQMFEIRLPVVSPPLREARPFDLELKITCHNIHLAKDSTTNDLFMILRENSFVIEKNPPVPWSVVIGDTNYIIPPKTQGFRVFKLEQNADGHPGWLEIFDLGDRIMFLSAAANKILVANASNGLCSDHLRDKLLETNCIYFAFDHSCLSLTSILQTFLDPWHILVTPMVDRHDVGVFSLKDCKIRPLGNFPDHRTQLRARSVWFTPNNA